MYKYVGIHVVCKLCIIKLTFWPTFSAKLAKDIFQVLTTTLMNIQLFWHMVSCRLVDSYRRFVGPCCLHFQGLFG